MIMIMIKLIGLTPSQTNGSGLSGEQAPPNSYLGNCPKKPDCVTSEKKR